jgi:hypothetical protein
MMVGRGSDLYGPMASTGRRRQQPRKGRRTDEMKFLAYVFCLISTISPSLHEAGCECSCAFVVVPNARGMSFTVVIMFQLFNTAPFHLSTGAMQSTSSISYFMSRF